MYLTQVLNIYFGDTSPELERPPVKSRDKFSKVTLLSLEKISICSVLSVNHISHDFVILSLQFITTQQPRVIKAIISIDQFEIMPHQ